MPRYFERKAPPRIENLAPGMLDGGALAPVAPPAPTVVGEAGTDAATH